MKKAAFSNPREALEYFTKFFADVEVPKSRVAPRSAEDRLIIVNSKGEAWFYNSPTAA